MLEVRVNVTLILVPIHVGVPALAVTLSLDVIPFKRLAIGITAMMIRFCYVAKPLPVYPLLELPEAPPSGTNEYGYNSSAISYFN